MDLAKVGISAKEAEKAMKNFAFAVQLSSTNDPVVTEQRKIMTRTKKKRIQKKQRTLIEKHWRK